MTGWLVSDYGTDLMPGGRLSGMAYRVGKERGGARGPSLAAKLKIHPDIGFESPLGSGEVTGIPVLNLNYAFFSEDGYWPLAPCQRNL